MGTRDRSLQVRSAQKAKFASDFSLNRGIFCVYGPRRRSGIHRPSRYALGETPMCSRNTFPK